MRSLFPRKRTSQSSEKFKAPHSLSKKQKKHWSIDKRCNTSSQAELKEHVKQTCLSVTFDIQFLVLFVLWFERSLSQYTFSMSSIVATKSMPKSMKDHSIPSLWYSSCSKTNIWWLKNCCSFSFVKLMQSCSKLLNYNNVVGKTHCTQTLVS